LRQALVHESEGRLVLGGLLHRPDHQRKLPTPAGLKTARASNGPVSLVA
jgi:hypothetical protein